MMNVSLKLSNQKYLSKTCLIGVRTALLESEDNECPDCKEKSCSPASLIPNRFLRNSVNTFKNETGYSRTQQAAVQLQQKTIQKPPPKEEIQQPPPAQRAPTPEEEKPPPESEVMKAPVQKSEEKNEPAEEKDKVKEKESQSEHAEKKKDLAPMGEPISSHDESDYEDNITVTVPPAHMQSHGPPRAYNGNSTRKSREGGYYVSCLLLLN